MPVRGDFRGLEQLRARIAALAAPDMKRDLARVLGEEAALQVDRGFREERTPYGQPWKPSMNANGHTLVQRGVLRNSLAPKLTPSGFTIATTVRYAAVHQYGATIKAKTPAGLRFKVTTGHTFVGKSGKRLAKPRANQQWVTKQQVTIPQRQYMPEGDVGPIWRPALEKAADGFIAKRMGVR